MDITPGTGLFYALKGSHQQFKNIRYTPYQDGAYSPLETYIRQRATAYAIKAGEVLFYHGAMVHYTDANTSGQARVAIGGVLIPEQAPNVHYYRPPGESTLEVYAVSESFYQRFNFFERPTGVPLIGKLAGHAGLPSLQDLTHTSV